MSATLRYRPDIEGLRAVAILPILLFHAGVTTMAGGFVGVDVFFVISGYLIASIILREQQNDSFTLLGFYRRRIVRILPALLAVAVATFIAGLIFLLPAELRRLGHSIVAALFFGSNIYFWKTSDYFAPAAELMPFLHTWSLGVEEQYYLLFPLILMLSARWQHRWLKPVVALGLLASLALGYAMSRYSNVAAFYLLPARGWELLAGVLIAIGLIRPAHSAALNGVLATLGAGLVVLAIFVVRADQHFPIFNAAIPVAGTVLLIAFGEQAWTGRILSLAPLRWIGRISYSTYLWHWPIIALYRIETGLELSAGETAALVAASIGAGAASYYLIEQPSLRRIGPTITDKRVVRWGLGGLVAVTGLIALVSASAAHWRPIDPVTARIAAYVDYPETAEYRYQFRRGPCFRGEAEDALPFDPALCTPLDPARRNVVVVGDSYAAQFWRAIALEYPAANVGQATASGCRPLLVGQGSARCREVVDYVLGPLLGSGQLDAVILAGRWLPEDLPGLAQTVSAIRARGAQSVVIGPVIEYHGEFPAILARARSRGNLAAIGVWRDDSRHAIDTQMRQIVTAARGKYVSPIDWQCRDRQCTLTTTDGMPMQFDYGHVTLRGARHIIHQLQPLDFAPDVSRAAQAR